MQSDSNEILLQLCETLQAQHEALCELGRNDLLLIESIRGPVSPEVLVVAAETVRSTLYSVDALGDKIRKLALRARKF